MGRSVPRRRDRDGGARPQLTCIAAATFAQAALATDQPAAALIQRAGLA
jgi:hypothetical protein